MADQTLNEIADARFLEVARLRSRVERAESAVGRVLALCDGAEALTSHQVRAAVRGES